MRANDDSWNAVVPSPVSPLKWQAADLAAPPTKTTKVTSHAVLPKIGIRESYSPCAMYQSAPGEYVYDFCQNMAGYVTVSLPSGVRLFLVPRIFAPSCLRNQLLPPRSLCAPRALVHVTVAPRLHCVSQRRPCPYTSNPPFPPPHRAFVSCAISDRGPLDRGPDNLPPPRRGGARAAAGEDLPPLR